jgi:site-specific DNA-cytosine methylase
MDAIGSYIFAGLHTMGVREHFDVHHVLEEGPYGVATARANMPDIPITVGPENWPVRELRAEFPDLDFYYGNPPCAAWSPLGGIILQGKDAWRTNDLLTCTRVHFNAVEFFRPKVWTTESVPQAYTRGWPFFRELTIRAMDLGYHVDFVLHNAMHVGANQHRKRMFMVASRVVIDWRCPWLKPKTTGEVLADMKRELGGKRGLRGMRFARTRMAQEFLEWVPPGSPLRPAQEEWMSNARRAKRTPVAKVSYSLRRMRLDKVAGAMIANVFVHPTEPRMLTVEEMLAFAGLPLDYAFVGSDPDRQIGRAVQPPCAAWLAENVKRACKTNRPHGLPPVCREVNFYKEPGVIKVMGERDEVAREEMSESPSFIEETTA